MKEDKDIIENDLFEYIKKYREEEFIEVCKTLANNRIWNKAQTSNEFKEKVKNFIKEIEEEKNSREKDFLKKVFLEGGAPLSKEETCIDITCLEIDHFFDKTINNWNKPDKREILSYIVNIRQRFVKIQRIVEECLESYFVNNNEIEEYVQMRIILADLIKSFDTVITIYADTNNLQ